MKRFTLSLLAAFGLLALGPAQAANMTSGWEHLYKTQEECIATAHTAIKALNYTVSGDKNTAFGWQGEYGISIRCIGARNIVVFFVYSANEKNSSFVMERLRKSFK